MKKSQFFTTAILICLILTAPAMAKKEFGPVPEPNMLSAVYEPNHLCLQWTDVPEAVKYSLELYGTAFYNYDDPNTLNEPNNIDAELWVEVSFGTSDRTDGGDMGDPNLCIPLDDLCDIIMYAIIDELEMMEIEPNALNEFAWGSDIPDDPNGLWAKVKSLTPGKGKGKGSGGKNNPFKGRQNNKFSEPLWVDPIECIFMDEE
ncbi:MAG: hypothetical protein ACYTER_02905 [Planctomycetota bacterium]|jgi:hypothetical protein